MLVMQHHDARFDATPTAFGFPYTDDDWVPLELTKGSGVFFNGYLLHRSLPNKSATSYRRAFANHYMSAESLLPWTNDGRLPPTKDMRGAGDRGGGMAKGSSQPSPTKLHESQSSSLNLLVP